MLSRKCTLIKPYLNRATWDVQSRLWSPIHPDSGQLTTLNCGNEMWSPSARLSKWAHREGCNIVRKYTRGSAPLHLRMPRTPMGGLGRLGSPRLLSTETRSATGSYSSSALLTAIFATAAVSGIGGFVYATGNIPIFAGVGASNANRATSTISQYGSSDDFKIGVEELRASFADGMVSTNPDDLLSHGISANVWHAGQYVSSAEELSFSYIC